MPERDIFALLNSIFSSLWQIQEKYDIVSVLENLSVLWRIKDPFTVWYHLEVLWKLTESRTQQREESGLWVEAKVGRVWAEGQDVSRQRRIAAHIRKKLSQGEGAQPTRSRGRSHQDKDVHVGAQRMQGEAGEGRRKDLAFYSFGRGRTINPLEPWFF